MKLFFAFLLLNMFACTPAFAQVPSVDVAVTGSGAYGQAFGSPTIIARKDVVKYGVVTTITDSTPAAKVFTCAVTDICTTAGHGFLLGLKVQVTTTGTLPAGLLVLTNYFVIPIDANTFYLASSLALAQAGTHLDITSTGTPTNTITPVALAGGVVKLQGSMDGTIYVDLPIKATGDATKSASVTATGSFYLSEDNVVMNYIRVFYALTAGQITISQVSKAK